MLDTTETRIAINTHLANQGFQWKKLNAIECWLIGLFIMQLGTMLSVVCLVLFAL